MQKLMAVEEYEEEKLFRCRKCGSFDHDKEFVGKKARYEVAETLGNVACITKIEPTKSEDEALYLTCRDCGYSWFSPTFEQLMSPKQ